MIDAGTILTVSIGMRTSGLQSSDDIIAAASSLLSTNDSIDTLSYKNQKSSLIDQITSIDTPFTATMRVKTEQAYNQPDDVLSIVKGEFYAATGNNQYPISGSVVNVTAPGGDTTDTGEGGQASPSPDTSTSISDAISSFFSGLKSDVTTLLIVVAGIIILILFLAAYGPNVGGIAKAAALA